jgi:hypothetical protein
MRILVKEGLERMREENRRSANIIAQDCKSRAPLQIIQPSEFVRCQFFSRLGGISQKFSGPRFVRAVKFSRYSIYLSTFNLSILSKIL